MDTSTRADSALLEHTLAHVFSSWVRELDLTLVQARPGEVVLALPVAPKHVHAGGVMSGQTLMAAADTAMVLAVTSQLGAFRPMTTVQMQTSFLRPVAPGAGAAKVTARVLRLGRNLVFGEVHIETGAGQLAAHATTTYALL